MADFAALAAATAVADMNRRRPSLTPTNSNAGQASSSRPNTASAVGSIKRSRSRSTSTTTIASNASSVLAGSSGVAATSPPSVSSPRYDEGSGGSGGASRGLGMTTNDTVLKGIQPLGGLGPRNINEDSPTGSAFSRSITSMSNNGTLLEEKEGKEDAPEEEYDDVDWEGVDSTAESKRSRASTLSSPTGSAMLSGIRRKFSDSKKLMRQQSPASSGGSISVDINRFKRQLKAGTSTTHSPLSGQTSSDEGSIADSTILTSQLEIPQTITYSQHKTSQRHHPVPPGLKEVNELNITASPSPKPSHEHLKSSMSSTSAVTLDQLSQSRPQTIPPRGPDQIHGVNTVPMPTMASVAQKNNLEVPVSVTASARVSSITQAPSSPSTSLNSKARSVASPSAAIASIVRSDSDSSSGAATIHDRNNASAVNALSSAKSSPFSNNHNTISSAPGPHKYLAVKDRKNSSKVSLAATARLKKNPPSVESPMIDVATSPKVPVAPASGMYWYKAPDHGQHKVALRAHTCTMVGSSIYVFGGCDRACYNDMHVFDTDSMTWSKPTVYGDIPPPLRAMTTTAVNKKLIIFGGGDGPTYYNDVYIFDTATNRYTKPVITGDMPSKRRAHTACFCRNNKLDKSGIYIFGGGDGERALDDIWCLDVSDFSKLNWRCIYPARGSRSGGTNSSTTSLSSAKGKNGVATPSGPRPTARGYHTANMVGNKLIVFGGSDGTECFMDVWIFNVETEAWKRVPMGGGSPNPGPGVLGGAVSRVSYPRLSHTATIVGSYLFVVGGHDGVEYSSEVLLLNLVTMQWDKRKVYGLPPSGRGYHGAVLHDSRLFIIGGFDGQQVFSDTYILELAVSSYYSQISQFTIDA